MRGAALHPFGLGLLLVSFVLAGLMVSVLDRWSGQFYWIILLGLLAYCASTVVLYRARADRRAGRVEDTSPATPGVDVDWPDSRAFERMVQNALRKLNDLPYLSESELVRLLPNTLALIASRVEDDGSPSDQTPLEKAQALREVLIETIEQLKPPGEPMAAAAPEALQFDILIQGIRPG